MIKMSVKSRRQWSRSTSVAALLAGAAMAGWISPAAAAFPDWVGTVSGDWFAGGNWSTNTAPAAADTVFVDTTAPNAATVNGGTANVTGLNVGSNGAGSLTIMNGGKINDQNGAIGNSALSNGTVTVTGMNSSWNSISSLTVGEDGNGTLLILSGASASDSLATIGDQGNSTGNVTVDGNGSHWTTAIQLTVGNIGTGTLTVSNGGQVNFLNALIGQQTGSVGTVSVTGAGSVFAGNGLTVGSLGGGTLNILAGAQVNDISAVLGSGPGSVGGAVVDGSGTIWHNTGSLGSPIALMIGDRGVGALTISNGAVVESTGSGPVTIANQATSTGILNIGSAPGTAPVAPGTLLATIVQFGAGTGTINFNHTGTGYVFAPGIEGAGTINQFAGETILTAVSGVTGPTNVFGGRLAVDGSLFASTVTVSGGGILGGVGTVGAIAADAGGIVGPGNSIGTLNVVGNVAFAPGSIYQVEVNAAGQGDKIVAGGAATINGGTVQVLAGAGNYASSTNYNILSATGGVSGTFAGVTSNLAFLSPSLIYDANNVNLLLTRNDISFAAVGITANQIAAGGGVESLGSGNAVNSAVLNLSASQARNAFDLLSGEVHASAQSALIEDSRFVRDAAVNRLRSAFAAVGASSGPFAAYAADGAPAAVAATTGGLAFWGQGFGSFGSTNGDGNAARLSRSTGGFLAGGDATAFDGVRIGALGGYSRTNFDVRDRSSSGNSDNYHLGLYAGSQWGALGLRTGAAYTWHQIDTSRSVLFPGFGERMSSSYAAGTTQVFGDLGYRIDLGRTAFGALAFEPFGNLAYVNLWTGGFGETGGTAALIGRSGSTDVTFSTLGLRGSTGFSLNGMAATAHGSLGWRHAYGDVTPASVLAFAGGGSSFGIQGVPIAQDSAVVEAGIDVAVARNVSIGLSYVGQAASSAQDHDVKANLNWRF